MAAPQWQMNTRTLLEEGFGVEDIALKLNRCVHDIRFMVILMRNSGILAKIYGGQK